MQEPNQAPVLDLGGPYQVSEGATVQLDASGSSDPDGDVVTWEWDLDGDGIWGETGTAASRGDEVGATPTYSAVDVDGPDTQELSLRVSDDDGLKSSATTTLTVDNIAPTVDAGANQTVDTGEQVDLAATFSDPGGADTHTAVVDWGDGTTATLPGPLSGAVEASHTYPDAGTYTVTVEVTDDDGDTGSDTLEVAVSTPSSPPPPNEPPEAADDTAETLEDEAVTIDVLANDSDPDGDTLTVSGVFQPGNGIATIDDNVVVYGPAAGFVGEDTFSYTVEDGQGGADTATVTIMVSASDSFGDVDDGHRFYRQIEWMADQGISNGFDDGTFRPGHAADRQAVIAFLYRLAGEPAGPFADPGFPDVDKGNPFYAAIAWAAEQGLANGYDDGTFRPGAVTTRQAGAAFLYRLAGEPTAPDPDDFSDVTGEHPFADAIGWMAEQGLSDGYTDGTFRPTHALTRQAAAAWLHGFSTIDGGTVAR